jgi:hypothetical protein
MGDKQPAARMYRLPGEAGGGTLHPSWRAFIEYCSKLGYGEIEKLTIQDGLPVLAERTKQKVKFTA